MRRLFAFALILALLLATAAMGEETFLDDTGAPVSLEAPTRVAALSGSLAQIWLLALYYRRSPLCREQPAAALETAGE